MKEIKLHILSDLLGKICHLRNDASKYDHHIINRNKPGYGINTYDFLLMIQNHQDEFFRFVDETPVYENGYWLYCVADSWDRNYYWFSLNQLIICSE
jgi:hypothetical protein